MIFGLAFLTGALLFAGLTSFGQNARMAEPLSVQIDRAVAQFGYGIREVSVTGQTHTSDREIFDALALDDAVSFLRFDLGAARARIEALPWVATAQVQRLLPDTLRIEITERRAIAVWAHDGREELIDETGRVLGRIALRKAPDLPRVQGPAAAVPAADLLKALASHPDLAERLVEARRIGGRRWTLELGGGTLVHLPAGSDTEALARLVELYRRAPRLVTTAQIVDLRMKGRTILSQKPRVSETAVPASAPAAAKERI